MTEGETCLTKDETKQVLEMVEYYIYEEQTQYGASILHLGSSASLQLSNSIIWNNSRWDL